MLITEPIDGQKGFEINWIVKDNQKKDALGFDPDVVEYGREVYDNIEEAKQNLKEKVCKSSMDWGDIRRTYFELIDGHLYDWNSSGDVLFYAEEL